jgi:SAM-dependent methyltransferase
MAYYRDYHAHLDDGSSLALRRDWRARLFSRPLVRWRDLRPQIRLIERHGRPGSLLEVGCGSGALLEAMRQRGWECSGLEMDPSASRFCRDKLGLGVEQARLEDTSRPAASYDAICLAHVFEHLSDPHAALDKLHLWLKPGGILLVTVPNGDSWQRRAFGDAWYGYDVPRHYFTYGRLSLSRLAAEHAYDVVECRTVYGSYSALLTSLAAFGTRRGGRILPRVVRTLAHPLAGLALAPLHGIVDAFGAGEGLTCVLRRSEGPRYVAIPR